MSFPPRVPFVVAEIGNNHGGDLDLAIEMLGSAAAAGADAVKFQTIDPERLLSREHPAYEEFVRECLPREAFRNLAREAEERGVVFLSTAFDPDSADFLESLGVPAFKIASGDLTYLPFLRHVARKGRPVLLSTGASTLEEIDAAGACVRAETDAELILLHCTSAYPCPDDEANLAVIPALADRYGCRVGFSDHTLGISIALAAVARGAVVLEKHFTIDRSLPGGDNEMSIIPEELRVLVRESERVYAAIGSPDRTRTSSEERVVARLRRSIVTRRVIAAGEMLQPDDLDAVRPETEGIGASDMDEVAGRVASIFLHERQPVRPQDLASERTEILPRR